jgi:hypothetical protein
MIDNKYFQINALTYLIIISPQLEVSNSHENEISSRETKRNLVRETRPIFQIIFEARRDEMT